MTTKELSRDERIFLSGCIKSMILADGDIAANEVDELDRLIKRLEFTDFEECLAAFDEIVRDTETFWSRAEGVSPEGRSFIISILEELALFEGIPAPVERKLLHELQEYWKAG